VVKPQKAITGHLGRIKMKTPMTGPRQSKSTSCVETEKSGSGYTPSRTTIQTPS